MLLFLAFPTPMKAFPCFLPYACRNQSAIMLTAAHHGHDLLSAWTISGRPHQDTVKHSWIGAPHAAATMRMLTLLHYAGGEYAKCSIFLHIMPLFHVMVDGAGTVTVKAETGNQGE